MRLNTSEEWHTLVAGLGLKGIASQLAQNCELDSWDGGHLRLRLDPACEHMRVASSEQRFIKALEQRLGSELRVDLRIARPEAETPAQREARLLAERQQEAEQSIVADPMVQSLQETFDASLVPGSIKPVEG